MAIHGRRARAMQRVDARLALLDRWCQLSDEVRQHGARLLAVSKYAPDEAVDILVEAGCTDFAESRPQRLRDRSRRWPQCAWHMIGPLQRNKAKYVGRHASMWHSLEDIETARAVARHVQGRVLPVLIQVNLSGDPQRHGVDPGGLPRLYEELGDLPELQPVGLMTMAPLNMKARDVFARLRRLRDGLFDGSLAELSMGMSHDFRDALEEGATMVRIGSLLFGDWDIRTSLG